MIGVHLAFTTSQLDPPDRLAAWRELVNRAFLPLAITPAGNQYSPDEFEGSVSGQCLAGVQVWLVRASPMVAVRARPHIDASGNDEYLLALHIRGTAHAAQADRQVTLRPGDFTLIDSSRPYSVAFPGPDTFEHVIYQIPRTFLDARREIGHATAFRVAAASAAGQLVSPFLRRLARSAVSSPGHVLEQAFVESGLDLAVSAVRAVAGYRDNADAGRRSPASELKDYVLAHLGDPALSPEAVARTCYISTRQLHRLFAREGVTFGTWVREQRLRRCREDLADLALNHLTIAEIAARWGFRSPAHFTRTFEARYQVLPRSTRT